MSGRGRKRKGVVGPEDWKEEEEATENTESCADGEEKTGGLLWVVICLMLLINEKCK